MNRGELPARARGLARLARSVRLGALAPVPSPCLSVCRMDERSGLCEGCQRTLQEIADWSGLDDTGRRQVWQRIEARLRLEDMA